jgi:phosphoglycerate kinase
MNALKMSDLDLAGKRVVIREDLNVPMADGKILGDQRIRAAVPTLRAALDRGAGVIVLSHLGRPQEGRIDPAFSLAPVASRLTELLGQPVGFCRNWLDGVECAPGSVVLCENVRFQAGESRDDESLSRKLAALGDIFVMDAFATAHRKEASTHGIAKFAQVACMGPLLTAEIEALEHALVSPAHPVVAIVGGAKVSTKLGVLRTLLGKVDRLILGGGIANTFLAATGSAVGRSACEHDQLEEARRLIAEAHARGADIALPVDVTVTDDPSSTSNARGLWVSQVTPTDYIVDIGPATTAAYARILAEAKTILWNGPLGVCELDTYAQGTRTVALAVADSQAYSLIGGGETVAALEQFGVIDRMSYVSTGGGAFLEFLEGKTLPALAILEERATERGSLPCARLG